MIGNPILLLLVVGPMAAAVIGYLIGRVNKSARDYFADAVTILTFLAMAFFFLTYKEGQEVSLVVPEVWLRPRLRFRRCAGWGFRSNWMASGLFLPL